MLKLLAIFVIMLSLAAAWYIIRLLFRMIVEEQRAFKDEEEGKAHE